MKSKSIKALSIQIRLSGLSFCILNRSSNTIEKLFHIKLEKKATPFEILNQLKTSVETDMDFEQPFDSVLCIYQNELSSLVPQNVFDEAHLADYLKFNAKILKTDYISYDTLHVNSSMNVYVPLVNVNNYLFDTFGSFVYKHASTILIDSVLHYASKQSETQLYINVGSLHFEIVAANQSKLIFYNTFDYSTKEDFIYYILFTIEQLKLDPETVKVNFTGNIVKDDKLHTIAYKYIRFLDFLEFKHNFKFSLAQEPKFNHSNFILLNSFN